MGILDAGMSKDVVVCSDAVGIDVVVVVVVIVVVVVVVGSGVVIGVCAGGAVVGSGVVVKVGSAKAKLCRPPAAILTTLASPLT